MDKERLSQQSQVFVSKTRKGVSRLVGLYHPRTWKEKGLAWTIGLVLGTYAVVVVILGILWSFEPGQFNVEENTTEMAETRGEKPVPGYATVATVIRIANTLLHKPGGYLSNDITPPGIYLDNIPSWEFGVLMELRDSVRALRNDFSRAQTQSVEDNDLGMAEPKINFDSAQWILPSSESQYEESIRYLENYLRRIADENARDGQFFTRADNLAAYIRTVEMRLGSLAQRLASSVSQVSLDINLAGDRSAQQSTPTPEQQRFQTDFWEIDNVFYEARGYTWALLHTLKALAVDFRPVLEDKNALVSLKQIILVLEAANAPKWNPLVLNGKGFGILANHSLVMASYISRANAALIDLRTLLMQG